MTYESSPATRLVATHCAACNRPLRDAASVEAGLGPECRSKYGAAEEPSSPDWDRARACLGDALLAATPPIATAFSDTTPSARRVANLLTERVAAARGTDVARRCVGAIRALGYSVLAAKLRRAGEVRAEGGEGAGDSATAVRVTGRVLKMFHTSPRFSAGRLVVDEVEGPEPPDATRRDPTTPGDELPFAGRVAVSPGDRVTLHGSWQRHPKFGLQLSVDTADIEHTIDREGLALYLAASPAFKGIGPAKAQIIAREFGDDDFEEILLNSPERIAEAARIPIDVVTNLRDEWKKSRNRNIVMTKLAALGLTNRQCELLVDEYGDEAPAIIEDAPYSIIGRIPGLGFKRVDEIGRRMDIPRDDPDRVNAGIIACVEAALDNGDTWIEYRELIAEGVKILTLDRDDASAFVESATDALIAVGCLHCQTAAPGLLVAKPIIWMEEDELAGWMRSDPNPHFAGIDLAAELRRADSALTDVQLAAGATAARHTRIVVTGAAGTGKTRLIRAITRLYASRGKVVVHAAPTGKAAKRIEESLETDCPPWGTFTLHRLLGHDGKTWAADRVATPGRKEQGGAGDDEEQDADGPTLLETASAVIVDETSMVDTRLAWQLFRVLRPSQAVILVGDHNQLPPVGPGNLLRDLIAWRPIPVVELTQVHRQAGDLLTSCTAVLGGKVPPSCPKTADGQRSPWTVLDRYRDVPAVEEAVSGLYSTVLEERLGFHLRNDVQLLVPTWRGPIGAHSLNLRIQAIVQRKLFKTVVEPVEANKRGAFYAGDRIIQLANDYDIGVMNGTIGVVVDPRPDGPAFDAARKTGKKPIVCRFSGSSTDIIASADDISLAYALSIHKAQGDQFPCVITIIHKQHAFQHHRNLLYTAVTRAQSVAIIIGDRWAIDHCAEKVETGRRRTFLSIFEMAGEEGGAGFSEMPAEENAADPAGAEA